MGPPTAKTPAAKLPLRPRRGVSTKLATALDVARIAGVSRSAVSRAYTEGASVAPATRLKVLAAAKSLKYRPNLFASALMTNRSFTIGIALSELDNQYYPEMLQLLSEQLAKLGYRLLLFITHGSKGHDPLLDELLRYRLDALILASSSLSFNNIDPSSNITSLTGSNMLGARTIAAYLAACGHRRFGYIAGLEGDSTDQERKSGFTAYLREHDLPAPVCVPGSFTFDGAVNATRTLLSRAKPPDAIFCVNDHAALATVQIARVEFGLEPGKDISVIGFDNVPIAKWPCFALTTYSQPLARMVDRTIELIRQSMEQPAVPCVHEWISGELIVRGSARLPRTGIIRGDDGNNIWRPRTT
jgi:DNA-binding LacI/PurR family transcriptional regulator